MEKKAPIKISLPIFIAIIVILVAVVFSIYMNMQNKKLEKEIANLREEITQSQTTKNELQEKLNSISNIANTDKENNETKQNQNDSNNAKEYKIDGTYECDDKNLYEKVTYTFSNGKVKYESLGSTEGTYEIKGDKIIIKYKKENIDPDGKTINYEYLNGESETLTIKDDSTIVTSEGTKYVKK